jgi:plastocyanin
MKSWTVVLSVLVLLTACSRPSQQTKNQPQQSSTQAPAYFHVDPSTAGTLSGKIIFTGKRPARKKVDMDEDPQCAALHKTPVFDQSEIVNRNGTLANVFVYVKSGLDGKTFAPSSTPVTIDQRGCWFFPRVLGIQVGQTLKVINSDPVTHNIHPRPHDNREWNHSQSPGAPPIERKFTAPEVMIRVKCNIHGWMHAWIGVVSNPYFAVTGSDGSFELANLPPGTYTIGAWQEVLGSQEQSVTISPSSKNTVDFTFKGE